MSWWSFKPYVSVAQRRANAMKEVKKLAGKGQPISPGAVGGEEDCQDLLGNGLVRQSGDLQRLRIAPAARPVVCA